MKTPLRILGVVALIAFLVVSCLIEVPPQRGASDLDGAPAQGDRP